MNNIENLEFLYKNSSLNFPVAWEGRKVDDGYTFIPQGSYLGHTLIVLSDVYENSGVDCDLVAAAINIVPSFLELVKLVSNLEKKASDYNDGCGCRSSNSLSSDEDFRNLVKICKSLKIEN
jgi:hypothetical protein